MRADDLDLLEEILRDEGIQETAAARIRRRGATEAPASLQQRRLWFLYRLDPDSAAYNIATALRLSGELDAAALEGALGLVIRRHEILRTTFRERDGDAWQIVAPSSPLRLACEDWRERRIQADALDDLVRAESRQKFDLERGPLLRVRLIRLPDGADGRPVHVCVICMHHIIADGWSLGLLFGEIREGLRALTAGRAPAFDELPVQYADYAAWQHEQRDEGLLAAQLGYWRRQLHDLPVLDLPTDYPRPRSQTFAGDLVSFEVPAEMANPLRRIGRAGTTLFMVLTAAFGVLLARRTRQHDIVLGTSVAQRGDRQTHGLIGFLVNMLVLRLDISAEDRFTALLEHVRTVVVDAFDHADLPYETLVEQLRPARDPSRNPLFQVALSLLNAPAHESHDSALTIEPLAQQSAARFDLELLFQERPGGALEGLLTYNTDLFRRGTAEQLVRELSTLLADIAADPDRPVSLLQLVTPDERRKRIAASAGPAITPRSAPVTVAALFDAQVARTPDSIALSAASEMVSYRELDRRANRLARCLIDDGIGPESIVAILLDRSVDLIVALLASLKAGAAYLPLDPAYPPARLAFMLRDSNARCLITTGAHQAKLAAAQPLGATDAVRVATIRLDDRATMARLAAYPSDAVRDEERLALLQPANLVYLIYTSGSTGRPKGAGITAAGLLNYLDWAATTYTPASANGTAFNLSASFDASVTQIYLLLLSGATLHLLDRHDEIDGLATLIRHNGPFSFIKTTPAIFDLLRSELTPAEMRRAGPVMILGGEALTAQSCAAWRAQAPETRLFNEYGPTETVVGCAIYQAAPDDQDSVPIGRPIWNTQLYLLDTSLEPVADDSVGELYIAGAGVARGYLGRGGLTADRFMPCPFGSPAGRMYRTGDLARRRADGKLVFLGRIDDQIKLRGFRIELGEIEAALAEHAAVQHAVVTVRQETGEQRLVAYVVPRATCDADAGAALVVALRTHAAVRLPAHMVPTVIQLLDALPLTPNGKLDRKALPAPDAQNTLPRRLLAPRTPIEATLCALFAAVLGVEQAGADDNFFTLGGHSLLAMRLISRIRAALGVEIPVRTLFDAPTVATLAGRIAQAADGPPNHPSKPPPTDAADVTTVAQASPGTAIPRVPRDQPIVLLPAQTRLWFLDRLEPGNPRYNIVFGLRLRGSGDSARSGLDESALQAALDHIVRRHESLRTSFRTGDRGPTQVIAPARAFALERVDLCGLSGVARASELAARTRQAAHHHFDLETGPLAVGWLMRLADDDHRLLVVMHHIVVDGWSFGVFARELRELYAAFRAGTPSRLPPLPIQYADYAAWQRARLLGDALAQQRDYWLRQLADLEPAEILPLDRPRQAQSAGRGQILRFMLEPMLERALAAAAARHGATLFMVLVAALAAVLHRASGATDLPIGTPVAGRDRVEVEDLIGFFVNTLVLRLDAAHDPTIAEFLARVRETSLAAFANREIPFEELVERIAPPRHRGRHPLFGVMVVLQNAPGEPLSLPGLSIAPEPIETAFSRFDLTLLAEPSPNGLACVIEYDADLLEPSTVERLVAHFLRACRALAEEPGTRLSELRLESEDERARRRACQHGAPLHLAPATVPEQILARAARQPDAIALSWDGGALSYAELARRVQRAAVGLQACGVSAESRVGAAFERSGEMIIALLGIMQAGAAYVPLDPHYPAARLAFTIEDSGACLILAAATDTLRAVTEQMPRCPPVMTLAQIDAAVEIRGDANALRPAPRDRLAYVIHTSGSSGTPKGVMVSQDNLWASTAARLAVYGAEQPRFALLSSFAFDSSVAGIFGTLCAGGTLVLPPAGAERDPARLLPFLYGERVTHSLMLPALYLILLDAAAAGELASLRTVIVAGEDCGARLVERHRRALPHARLANEYGPTEASVWCTVRLWPATADASTDSTAEENEVTIGSPIRGAHVWIRHEGGAPAQLGVQGELCIGGPGVARGYAGHPARTAESFVPDPESDLPGARCYRSGDRAQFTPSGALRLLGRIDRQIKVRGFRVEPGEVEAQILQAPWIREATVITTRDARERLTLVAHVAAVAGVDISEARLRAWLAERLPAHMVPTWFVWHDALPRSAGGKIDRSALEMSARRARHDTGVVPRDHLELQLVRIWEDVLAAERVGIDDDFFELGGHSLLAVELIAEVRRRLGRDVPLAALFSTGTVARLAEALRRDRRDERMETREALVPLSRGDGRPLFLVHQAGGNVMSYLHLARALGASGIPLFGLQARGLDGQETPLARIEEMAACYIGAIRRAQPAGPYRIGGHSIGGRIAQEMARQLEDAGADVNVLIAIDVPGSEADFAAARRFDETEALAHLVSQIEAFHGCTLEISIDALRAMDPADRVAMIVDRMTRRRLLADGASAAELGGWFEVYKANMRAIASFTPRACRADIHAIATPALRSAHPDDLTLGWGPLTRGRVQVIPVDGDHMTLLAGAHAADVARAVLQACGAPSRADQNAA
jgi:amino acid adenylation domain-containing protein